MSFKNSRASLIAYSLVRWISLIDFIGSSAPVPRNSAACRVLKRFSPTLYLGLVASSLLRGESGDGLGSCLASTTSFCQLNIFNICRYSPFALELLVFMGAVRRRS